jgi:hypothetical protein
LCIAVVFENCDVAKLSTMDLGHQCSYTLSCDKRYSFLHVFFFDED